MVTLGGFNELHLLLITGHSGNFLCFHLVFVLNHHIKDNTENCLGN